MARGGGEGYWRLMDTQYWSKGTATSLVSSASRSRPSMANGDDSKWTNGVDMSEQNMRVRNAPSIERITRQHRQSLAQVKYSFPDTIRGKRRRPQPLTTTQSLSTCPGRATLRMLTVEVAPRAVREHEAKVDVDDVAARVQQDVSVVTVLDLSGRGWGSHVARTKD